MQFGVEDNVICKWSTLELLQVQEAMENFVFPDEIIKRQWSSENDGSQHFQKYFCCKVLFFAKLQR